MSSNDEIKTKYIKSLPNSIDGNGSTFIDKLKKVLVSFGYSIADNASTAANVSQVTELTLTETKTNSAKNIYVQFNKDGVKKFKEARIWVRTSAVATFTLDGVTTTGEYTKSGVSDSTTYYVKVVAVDTNDNVAEFSTAPVASIIISAGSSSNPNPPTNLVVTWQGDVPTWSWRASSTPGNSSCFYELRTDNNPGSATNRFATVWWQAGTDIYTSNGVPTTNVGTVYCYFRNEYGLYSVPLKKDFAFPSAVRPNPPRFEQVDGGFLILIDDFPPTYSTASIEVIYNDGTTQTYQSSTTTKQIFGVSGRYKVRYKFNGATSEYDTEWSEYQEFELDRNPDIQEIDGSKIINGTVSGNKIIDGAITAGKTNIAAINSNDGNLNANTVNAAQIVANAVGANAIAANAITAVKIASNAVTSDKILAGSVTAGKIASNAITADNIQAGQLVVTGGTGDKVTIANGAIDATKLVANSIKAGQIDADNIWGAVVAAGAVSATKITADQLSATTISLTNNQGVNGGAVTLNANGLNCELTNGSKVQFNQNGMSFMDSNGTVFSQLARFKSGSCSHGDYINLGWDVTPSAVLIFPYSVQTMVPGYTSVALYIRAYPTEVTSAGFRANVFTALGEQTYSDCTWSSITTLVVGNIADSSTQRDYYTDWSTVSGILAGETEIEFNVGVHLKMTGAPLLPVMGYAMFLDVQQSTDNGQNWVQVTYVKLYQNNEKHNPVDENYYPDLTFSITDGAQVRFRYKWEVYWTQYHDGGNNHYVSHSANSYIKARVGSETPLAAGTAHYLVLG